MANVHPWFANVTVQTAAAWTAEFFEETNVQPAALLSNKVRWPQTTRCDAENDRFT